MGKIFNYTPLSKQKIISCTRQWRSQEFVIGRWGLTWVCGRMAEAKGSSAGDFCNYLI